MNLNKGVKGFYVGGSTAEAFLLSLDERKYLLDIVSSIVKKKATLISHIGCISTSQAIELGKHAEKAGVDAISSIPPFYYNFSFAECKKYYFDIVNAVNVPMIVYNFPAFSGVTLTTESVGEFFSDNRFIGLKHTSNDFFMLERVKSIFKNKIVFNGFDEMFLAGLSMGADGGIGSTYNFMAEKFIAIQKLFSEGNIAKAQEIQTAANTIIKALVKVGVMPGEKTVLNLMGLDFGACRAPFKALTDEEIEFIKATILPLL